ncbi:hypothetical protein KFK09_021488 [Dendrobium nobile]|uniref:Uncharacterized protein n=1 Tax=Dendrobium nobile TaxID=94219 RepID=A0A8T3AQ16_DENNO|nr:hypothetical protein KFK09_021488 [Dendrobium nobile]
MELKRQRRRETVRLRADFRRQQFPTAKTNCEKRRVLSNPTRLNTFSPWKTKGGARFISLVIGAVKLPPAEKKS